MPRNPDQRSVHINAPLTNVSVAWMQDEPNAADLIFAPVPVQKQGDLYWKYDRGEWWSGLAEKRAAGTESAGGGWNVSTDSYYCDVYAFHQDIDDQTLANADSAFNIEADSARFVTGQISKTRENLFLDNFMKTGVWTVNETPNWATLSSADPIYDVRDMANDMRAATGFRPNTLLLSPTLMEHLMRVDDIQERIKYTQTGIITRDLLAAAFDVDRVVVIDSVRQPSTGGDTLQFSLGSQAIGLLAYSNPRPSLRQPSCGYTFNWTGLLGAGATGSRVKRWRMEEIESIRIESSMAFDQKLVAPELGTFITATIS